MRNFRDAACVPNRRDMLDDVRLRPGVGPTTIEAVVIRIAALVLCRDEINIIAADPDIDRNILLFRSVSLGLIVLRRDVWISLSVLVVSLFREINRSISVPLRLAVPLRTSHWDGRYEAGFQPIN